MPSEERFFVAGGTMRPGAASYVARAADEELLRTLRRGEYCYILETRQVGKSSLVIRAANRLRAEGGVTIAIVDLQKLGTSVTQEQWYESQLYQMGAAVDREEEVEQFWSERKNLGLLDRWLTCIRRVILPSTSGRLIIFIDEIDLIRLLPFPTDEFFAGIRGLHNARANDPESERIVFCLAGVAVPNDLIRNEEVTPFNIARRIVLADFSQKETVEGFAAGFSRPSAELLKRIWYWTGGQPYLTQILAERVADDESATGPADVDRICRALYLAPGGGREQNDNLRFVSARLLGSRDLADVLGLYRRVFSGSAVRDDGANPLSDVLRLSGIVRTVGGRFEVRNEIYRRVFDEKWIDSNLPLGEAGRQKEAYVRGRRRALRVACVAALIVFMAIWAVYSNSSASQARRLAEVEGKAKAQAIEGQRQAEHAQEVADAARAEAVKAREKANSAAQEASVQASNARRLQAIAEASSQELQVALHDKNASELRVKKALEDAQKAYAALEEQQTKLEVSTSEAVAARDIANRAAIRASRLNDESTLLRFKALARTNPQLTVAGALASIEALGRSWTREAYVSLLESLARLPRNAGTIAWKRRADIRPRSATNQIERGSCTDSLDTMEQTCIPSNRPRFASRNYIVVAPDSRNIDPARPASDLQYWDIWNRSDFQAVRFPVPPDSALSPSGRYLATPEPSGIVILREFPGGKELARFGAPVANPRTLPGGRYSVAAAVQFSPDERYLVTSQVHDDFPPQTEYSLWDIAARRRVSWYVGAARREFVFSPNATGTRHLWMSDGSVCQIPETPKTPKEPGVPLKALFKTPASQLVRFSDDGSKLLVTATESALLYRLPNETPSVFATQDWAYGIAFSPDSRLVAFLLHNFANSGLVRVFETDTLNDVKRVVNEAPGEIKFEDNSHLLTSTPEGAIRWALNDTEPLTSVGSGSSLAVFSPNGEVVATGHGLGAISDQSLTVFDLGSAPARRLFEKQAPRRFDGLNFSADSAVLAAGIRDFPRALVFPLKEGGPERPIDSTRGRLEGVTPDARYASFENLGETYLVETAPNKATRLAGRFLAFPDVNTIAGCFYGQRFRYDLRTSPWIPETGVNFRLDCGHVAASADGRFAFYHGMDGVPGRPFLALWNTSDGALTRLPWSMPELKQSPVLSGRAGFVFLPELKEIRRVNSGEMVFRVKPLQPGEPNQVESAFSPNESIAVVSSYLRTAIVDLTNGQERCAIPQHITPIGFDATARYVLGIREYAIQAWRTADCQPEVMPNLTGSFADRALLSPDGKYLAWTHGSADRDNPRRDDRVKDELRITIRGTQSSAISAEDIYTAAVFSPDTRFLTVGTREGTARTLDLKAGPPYKDAVPPQIFDADVTSLAISPVGRYTAAAAGTSLRLWETQSGRVAGEIQESARVVSAAFSPNGKLLAATVRNGNVEVLTMPSMARVQQLAAESRLVEFSSDGQYLAMAGGNGFTVWDCKTWKKVATEAGLYDGFGNVLGAHFASGSPAYVAFASRKAMVWTPKQTFSVNRPHVGGDIYAAALSPDGEHLLLATERGFEVWSVRDNTSLGTIGEAVPATGLTLSPDGTKVAILYSDGRAMTTFWNRKDLIAEACRRLGTAAFRFESEVKDTFDGQYNSFCRNPLP